MKELFVFKHGAALQLRFLKKAPRLTMFILKHGMAFSSVQLSHSVVSDSSQPHELQLPGLPVHRQLLEFTQIHVHQVGDAIQPSHPLSSPSPPAPNPSQHQGPIQ